MKLRPATMDDAELLFAWRNDPETRANSVSTEEVAWADHIAWLSESLEDPRRELLIAEVAGAPVGTLRIDDSQVLSWTVAPHARGTGVGKRMVALVAKHGHRAQIRRENIASRRIAEAAGFRLVTDGEIQEWVVDGN